MLAKMIHPHGGQSAVHMGNDLPGTGVCGQPQFRRELHHLAHGQCLVERHLLGRVADQPIQYRRVGKDWISTKQQASPAGRK